MAYSRDCGCGLVGGTVYRIRHDSRGGRRDGKRSLLLVSAASFVNAWAVLLVHVSLSPAPVVPASRVTDGGSSQDEFLPHQEMAQREVRGSVGSALMAQRCFHTPLRSPNRQMPNAWKQQHRKEARKMNDSPKSVDCKVLNKPDKINLLPKGELFLPLQIDMISTY